MDKKERELLQGLEAEKSAVRALIAEEKIKDAEERMESVRALQKKLDIYREVKSEEDDAGVEGTPVEGAPQEEPKDINAEYRRVFLRNIRNQKLTPDDRSIVKEYRAAVMHEGGATGQDDGGSDMLVPQDLQTKINELIRTLNDLSAFITVETVSTLSGSRVLEKDGDIQPLAVVEEYGDIQLTDNPQFTTVGYTLVKRAGYLPLTSELLKDSDQNILGYVVNWIGRKNVITRNAIITKLIADVADSTKTAYYDEFVRADLANINDLAEIKNLDLDPALVAAGGIILTNQDGFNWLDQQVDGMGRYYLQDDITRPGAKQFRGLPVEVALTRFLPNIGESDNEAFPFIIGNLKQFMVMFTDGAYSLDTTREGGDSWRKDSIELRTIARYDCKTWDLDAAKYGQLTPEDDENGED